MPMRKTKLSRVEETKYLSCLKWLQARGVDLEIAQELLESSSPLEITIGRPPAGLVCDLRHGGTAYAVWVRLVLDLESLCSIARSRSPGMTKLCLRAS